jgi:hypothetical protein
MMTNLHFSQLEYHKSRLNNGWDVTIQPLLLFKIAIDKLENINF